MDLVSRVKAILLNPRAEWQVIDTEPTTVSSLYQGYIMPLAAIPAVCGFVGTALVGISVAGISYKVPFASALTAAVVRYALALGSIYLLALLINAMAPSFEGQKSEIQALKVAAYSATAFWVAGIFVLVPSFGILAILGFYSLYLLYVGLPIMMKAPAAKAMGYTVVVLLAMLIIGFVANMLVGALVPGATIPVILRP